MMIWLVLHLRQAYAKMLGFVNYFSGHNEIYMSISSIHYCQFGKQAYVHGQFVLTKTLPNHTLVVRVSLIPQMVFARFL